MDELLMCSICIERYHERHRQPVLLPRCGHSFCRSCVTMLVSGGSIVCPTCRNDQRIESAERLPTEYTLLAIIQAQEDSSKETCERHGVKLSFWCRTCAQATCGECLFEDHPTHTHDVTKASKYITEMKQNAYDIAVKFMEVLDEREQSFYRQIFSNVKRISNALRNVTALRKDMEEARELMKGIKEEDSIKSATALSEAAKFLGLKWNIQDANFLQKEAEEKAKAEASSETAKTDKERILEEEMEREKEKLKQDGKSSDIDKEKTDKIKAVKEKTDKEKDREARELKRALRKSKTMSSVEMASLADKVEKMGAKDLLKKLETIAEQTAKGDKKDIDIPAKPKESQNKPEDKKVEEISKPRLTKKALAERLARVTSDPPKAEEASATSTTSAPSQNEVKSADETKTTEATKVPEGTKNTENNDTSKDSKNPEEPKNTESSKNIQEGEPRSLSPTPSSVTSEAKDDTEDEDLTSVIEKLQEEIKFLKEGGNVKELEPKATESINADSGLSEDSKAAKLKEEEKVIFETKLMDCIQVAGFMIAVEADDGRYGEIEWGPQGLHIHCLQFHSVTYDIVIKTNILNTMLPSMNPIAFLELSAEQHVIGRVYIRLWGHLRRAHNFLTLCIGDRGHSYLNTKFLQGYNVGLPGERLLGGDYESNNGRGGKGILDDLEWNCDYAMPMKAGMITAAGTGQIATNSLFLLCSQSDPERNFSCPFGIVCEGLKVVKEAVQHSNTKDVWITDCGVLIVPPVKS